MVDFSCVSYIYIFLWGSLYFHIWTYLQKLQHITLHLMLVRMLGHSSNLEIQLRNERRILLIWLDLSVPKTRK